MENNELPADVALMWRLRETPRRGPKPSLTLDDIVAAAIAIADAEGLAAVSMARVAERLGNSTMALYRHVKSKDDLLVIMSDAALERPEPMPEGIDWRTGLTFWADGVMTARDDTTRDDAVRGTCSSISRAVMTGWASR